MKIIDLVLGNFGVEDFFGSGKDYLSYKIGKVLYKFEFCRNFEFVENVEMEN